MNKVFVYGSLKKGKALHHAMDGAKFLGEGLIQGVLFDLGSFPAVIEDPPEELLSKCCGYVKGELYEVNHKIMKRLDQIEGHPIFYIRKPTTVNFLLKKMNAWVYVIPYSHINKPRLNKHLESGVWNG